MKKLVISGLAIAMMGLSGCVPYGSSSGLKNISSIRDARHLIKRGMSMEQVKRKMGSPMYRRTINNVTQWSYVQNSGMLGGGYKSLVILFNGGGRVKLVRYMDGNY